MVHIKGKTLSHKVYELDINSGSTINDLKNKFSELIDHKIHEYEYKLIHLGKVISDDEVITDDYDNKLFIIMTTKRKVNLPEVPKAENKIDNKSIKVLSKKKVEEDDDNNDNDLPPLFSNLNNNQQMGNLSMLGYLLNGQMGLLNNNSNMQNVNQLLSQLGNIINPNNQVNGNEEEDEEDEENNNDNEDDCNEDDDNQENDEDNEVPQVNINQNNKISI